ncbi:hypothetical protein ACIA8J_14665 [Streptomyces asoensis]|uniref:hypothetical protein n=1 Tax=Streptomyces asoensis TaxID=249586 RepID=UPI00379A3AD1
MLKWALDLCLSVLTAGLEVAALVAYFFVESLKKWAAQGRSRPDEARRFILMVSVGSLSLALSSYGFSRADLPVACATQAVLAALLTLLLILGAGSECRKRISRFRRRR